MVVIHFSGQFKWNNSDYSIEEKSLPLIEVAQYVIKLLREAAICLAFVASVVLEFNYVGVIFGSGSL